MNRQEQLDKLVVFLDGTIREYLSSYLIESSLSKFIGLYVGIVRKEAIDYLLNIKGLDESDCGVIRDNIKSWELVGEKMDEQKVHSIALYLNYSRDQDVETVLIEPIGLDDGLFMMVNLHYIKYMTGEPQTIKTKIPMGSDGNLSLVVNGSGKFGDFIFIEYILKLIAYNNLSSITDPTFGLCVDYGRNVGNGDIQFSLYGSSKPTKILGINYIKVSEVELNDSTPTVKMDLFSDLRSYPLYMKFEGYSKIDSTVATISIAGDDFEWIRSDDVIDLLINLDTIIKKYEEQ